MALLGEASIIIDQATLAPGVAGKSRTDGVLSQVVTLRNADNTNITRRQWILLRPRASASVLTTPTSASCQFTPDVDGTYAILLLVNEGLASTQKQRIQIAVKSVGGFRYPAQGESNEANWTSTHTGQANETGWWEDIDAILRANQALIDGSLVSVNVEGDLPNSRQLTAGAGIDIADAGAGSTLTISVEPGYSGVSAELDVAGQPENLVAVRTFETSTHDATSPGQVNLGADGTTNGDYATVLGGKTGEAGANYATVVGGEANTASALHSTVVGGDTNEATGAASFIGGGETNTATGRSATVAGGLSCDATADYATVGGGNTNVASGAAGTVGGGSTNTAGGAYATIGGGQANTTSSEAATVAGGQANTAGGEGATVGGGGSNITSALKATIAGGQGNAASGAYSAILGGRDNVASASDTTVIGRAGTAMNAGSTVITDGSATAILSTADNQITIHATGGQRHLFPSGQLRQSGFSSAANYVEIWDGQVTTTDDTAAKINFITIPTGQDVRVRGTIKGKASASADAIVYTYEGTFLNVGGVITTMAALVADTTSNGMGALFSASLALSGAILQVSHKGEIGFTVYWTWHFECFVGGAA